MSAAGCCQLNVRVQCFNAIHVGSELVDWLLAHVDGFTSRRDARQWATNVLLRPGFIRHTLNKNTFSEQCYYVFTELAAQAEYQLQALEREFELAGGTSSSQTLTAAGAGGPGASGNNTSGLGGTGASGAAGLNGGGGGQGALSNLTLQQLSLKSADLYAGTALAFLRSCDYEYSSVDVRMPPAIGGQQCLVFPKCSTLSVRICCSD